jgi:hypothetical protein
MGKASREKRARREELPENLAFGPEFLNPEPPELIVHAGLASAHGSVRPESIQEEVG